MGRLVEVLLKCGCRGDENIDCEYVGIRFVTQEPCAAHEEWLHRWRHLDETALAWRDEAAVVRHQKERALFDEWRKVSDAAAAAGEKAISLSDFLDGRLEPEDEQED